MKTEIRKKSKVKALFKGTLKFFLKLICSLIVLVALLNIFSALFHSNLTDSVSEWLELREKYSQEEGFVGDMLNWEILGIIWAIPLLFFWGYEVYFEYNKGALI